MLEGDCLESSTVSEVAKELGIEPRIHNEDFIFLYHLDGHDKRTIEEAVFVYFHDGAASAEKLRLLIRDYFPEQETVSLLEFASGYGCLTRHLIKEKDIRTTACDIHPQAIDFIETVIGVPAVLSSRQPEDLVLEEKYDVVFALSFFSHMPPTTFGRWLNVLLDQVADKGILIFTTHGRVGQSTIGVATLGPEGNWFRPMSEQRDLPTSDYGTMLVTPSFVFDAVATRSDYVLRFFCEGYW